MEGEIKSSTKRRYDPESYSTESRVLIAPIVIVMVGALIGSLANAGEPQKMIPQLRIYETL